MHVLNSSAILLFSRILSNPEILRQLQNFQQMQQQQEEEKSRKLQEMKQQEEEFDKHLAQTVHVGFRCLFLCKSMHFVDCCNNFTS